MTAIPFDFTQARTAARWASRKDLQRLINWSERVAPEGQLPGALGTWAGGILVPRAGS